MKFEEWNNKKSNPFIGDSYWDMLNAWNAAIDEAVRTMESNKCAADGYHACSHQDVFINAIKELKE